MKAAVLSKRVMADISAMQPQVIRLLKELCAIPAPSNKEELRAKYVCEWFHARGMEAYIDEALNVIAPVALDRYEEVVVIMAHTDTVFPDMEPMPMREENGRLYCPGVGDDTANLAALMMLADYVKDREPSCGILFVANSGEEGLGNLKGCKAIMKAFAPRVKAFVSLDGGIDEVCARAVGSSRYRITATTRGGHSFSDFGNANAIAVLAGLIDELYCQQTPEREGSKTTFNVGLIEGGTSVNTIAQSAQMLYEYRSDDASCLEEMEKNLRNILRSRERDDARIQVDLIGLRPCAKDVDPAAQRSLEEAACQALRLYAGTNPEICSGSTDCNIPLSMGVPSVCFGVYRGEGAHTREEWVELASIENGMKAAASLILGWYKA